MDVGAREVPVGGPARADRDGRDLRDTGRGTWWVLELNHLQDGAGALHLGHYDDEYRRTDEGWQFASRRFAMVYRGALDPGTVVPLPPG